MFADGFINKSCYLTRFIKRETTRTVQELKTTYQELTQNSNRNRSFWLIPGGFRMVPTRFLVDSWKRNQNDLTDVWLYSLRYIKRDKIRTDESTTGNQPGTNQNLPENNQNLLGAHRDTMIMVNSWWVPGGFWSLHVLLLTCDLNWSKYMPR